MGPKVSIVILNWNGWKDTIKCLESLYQITYQNYDVIVVDNDSKDGSVEKIREYAGGGINVESKFFKYNPKNKPIKIIEYTDEDVEKNVIRSDCQEDLPSNKKLTIIKNKENYGCAKGNNIGMRYALKYLSSKYIALLNNDTVVEKEFLTKLIEVAESDAGIGMCGPKMLRMDDPKIIDCTGHVFRLGRIVDRGVGKVDKNQYDEKIDIVGTIGAAALYRKDMLEKNGLFDESFITYAEDADLSWKAHNNGWLAKYVPTSIVYHKRGGTINKDENLLYEMRLLIIKNTATIVKRYGTKTQKFLFTLLWMGSGTLSYIEKIRGKSKIGIYPYLKTLQELYRK
jgi:GT2 family glycosyltransferase